MSAQPCSTSPTALERLDELAADEGLQSNCMFQLSLILARIALEPFADSYKEATEQALLGLIRNKPKNNVVHLFDPAPVQTADDQPREQPERLIGSSELALIGACPEEPPCLVELTRSAGHDPAAMRLPEAAEPRRATEPPLPAFGSGGSGMGLVLYALKYRISCYVGAILVVLGGIGAAIVAPKDVLPTVDIPVVVVVWTYNGSERHRHGAADHDLQRVLAVEQRQQHQAHGEHDAARDGCRADLFPAEREHRPRHRAGRVGHELDPGRDAARRSSRPIVMRFSASSVPVIQLSLSSKTESQAKLYDYGQYRIRQTLTQVPGSTLPVTLRRRALGRSWSTSTCRPCRATG